MHARRHSTSRLTSTFQRVFGPSAFYLNVSYITLGAVGSQVVLFAASAVLARIYSPTEFGGFSVGLAVASLIAVVATLELDTAVPLAEDDEDAASIATAAIVCAAVTSVVTLAALVGIRYLYRAAWLGVTTGASPYTIAVTVFAIALWSSLRMLQSRLGNFRRLSTSSITSALTQSVVQVGAGVAGVGPVGLMIGYFVGRFGNAASLARGLPLRLGANIGRTGTVVRTWLRFSVMTTPPNLLNAASVSAIAPFVAGAYGVAFSGLFAFSARVLAVPSVLVGQAVAVVFYPKIAEVDREGRSPELLIRRATTGLLLIAVPIFGVTYLFGPEIFAAAFGAKWRVAGEIATIMSPWLILQLISSPLSGYITVRRRWGRLFALSAIETALRLGSFGLAVFGVSALDSVRVYSFVGAAISTFYIGWCLRLAGSGLLSWMKETAAYLIVVIAGYVALQSVKSSVPFPEYAVLGSILTLGLALWAVLWLRISATAPGRHART